MKNTLSRLLSLHAGAALLCSLPLAAHVVPPEKLHPVAESYRRSSFLLTLNPVPWEAVIADAKVIAGGLAEVAPAEASALEEELMVAVARGREGGPEVRRAVARKLSEDSTRAVASLLSHRLKRARAALGERERAAAELDKARQLWAAFEREIRLTDPGAFVRLGRCWIELQGALGSPGFGAMPAVPARPAVFDEEAAEVESYLESSYFDPAQEAPRAGLALPVGSPTFDATRPLFAYLPPGSEINKQLPRPRQVLNMAERDVDERDTTLIALGDMGFDSPRIFGEPARSLAISCNTCHNKSITNPQLFVPGLSSRRGGIDVDNAFFAPHANDGVFDPLDIPDLRGIRFTGPYGRDGRFDSLREFTRNVIVNEFNGPEPEPVLLDGLVAYMLQFDFLPNPLLENDGTLVPGAPEAALRGEELFNRPFPQMAGRSCASCHVPSDHFLDRQRHDIGSVEGSSEGSRDRSLDTPTLLSSSYTAPYFHDGSQPTLRSVVEWFDARYELGLSSGDTADLTAYLEAVGSGTDAYEDTIHTLEAELEEFSFFLSALDFLNSRDEHRLVQITLQTVADEIHAHKWDVQDRQQLPTLNRLASLIESAASAIGAGEWVSAEAILDEYRALYEEHQEVLR